MASSSSETSDICSPAGSVLINRALEDSAAPFQFLPDFPETENTQDVQDTSKLPTANNTQRKQSSDWIHWDPADAAVLRLTLDESGSLDFDPFNICPPESPASSYSLDNMIYDEDAAKPTHPHTPFQKWMRTLRRRAGRRQYANTIDETLSTSTSIDGLRPMTKRTGHRRQSSSGSSFGFVEAVKTASVSLASGSVFARSRRTTISSSRTQTNNDCGSRASMSSNRCSEDSNGLDKPRMLDRAAVERSLQRRRILEELIRTEEGYIGDVRFLMNVYVTILVSLPTMPQGLRSSINQNLAEVVDLHEELLGELHRAVPHSEYTQLDPASRSKRRGHNHQRIRSLNVVPENDGSMSWIEAVPGMVAEPNIAADVAKVFTNKMNRFFVYEEYGAKYEMMMKDIASAHRTMPQWETYQKGLETLAASISPSSDHGDSLKKALTIGDLLVKPIQRVCRYPLLFAELLKHTPVVDSPYAHMEVENTLIRLREATSQINQATDDARVKAALEKTWLLQDRLVFPHSKLDAASKNRIRSFGHVQLCGALHICWQSKEGVQGQYMVTLLYKDWLCLASASRVDQIYTLQACVPLSQIKVEAVDNGRGLQCHNAPFSWKIVFECNYQLYEMMMTACTPREEDEWRSRLELGSVMIPHVQDTSGLYSSVFLNIRSLGTVYGKQGTIARKISIHRATTVGPKSPLCNVILRNTSVEKEVLSTATATINRSQSLLATKGRVPVLAPSRGDRARLEALLSDVWTREALPFPGMTARARNEHIIRTSAHSVMRKLSVTSITSTFTKRSASLASIPRGGSDEESGGEEDISILTAPPLTPCETAPAAVEMPLENCFSNKSRLSIINDDYAEYVTAPPTLRAHSLIDPGSTVDTADKFRNPRVRRRITKKPSLQQLGDLTCQSSASLLAIPPSPSAPAAPSALRARSVNDTPLKRQASLLSRKSVRSVCSAVESGGRGVRKRRVDCQQGLGGVEYEDGRHLSLPRSLTSRPSTSPSKAGVNRRSRVDMLRRGTVAQGIRGFFR